jgi:hypothetical protein
MGSATQGDATTRPLTALVTAVAIGFEDCCGSAQVRLPDARQRVSTNSRPIG